MNLTDYFTDDKLLNFLKLGLPDTFYVKPISIDALGGERGILVVDKKELKYQKIQVYHGHSNGRVFRVTSGWCENGSLVEKEADNPKNKDHKTKEKVLSVDSICAIGAGYPMEHFDITLKLIAQDRVYLIGTFEPNLFGRSQPQDNTRHL